MHSFEPDWRWQRSCVILERGVNATVKRDGIQIQQAVRCMRQLEKVTTDRGVRGVVKKYPNVFLAMQLLREDSLRVWEIKARTLAGQTDRTIARAVGLTVSIVATFLNLFFDVRGRLAARSWIRWQAIGLRLDQAPSAETLALWHCWRRGSGMVEPWSDFLQNQAQPNDLQTEIGCRRAAIQLLIDIQQLQNTPEIRQSLLKKFAFLIQKLPAIPNSVSVEGVFSRNEARFLEEIVWKEPDAEVVSQEIAPQHKSHTAPARQLVGFAKAG